MSEEQAPQADAEEGPDRAVKMAAFWLQEISQAQTSFEAYTKRAQRVVDRYRDERTYTDNLKRKFNILWSNTQVLKPALYGRMPKPEVSRRYDDQDQVGRVAATMLERCLLYEVEQYPYFNNAMSCSVEDRLLPGRGVAWVRYEPHIEQEAQISEDVDSQGVEPQTVEKLDYECTPPDYVNWQDFLHNPSRTWEEVWWVARRVWMTKDEGEGRFGEIFASVPVDSKPTGKGASAEKETPKDALKNKAQVWEIWDKTDRRVYWIAVGFRQALDEKEDPLELEEFFPCPKPLFATLTTGSLIPIPDYCEYQDQAEELDTITQRIAKLTAGMKIVGVYNAEYKGLKRILNEGVDNDLVPVPEWAAFAEKGGMKGAIDWLPIMDVATTLEKLYVAREQVLSVIYQTMGLSDIMRGSTKATETLGAQQLKANFGSMRLRSPQEDVARFATDILRIMAQIICSQYSPETILRMSGIQQTEDGKNQQLVQAALQLLKNGTMRDFRISIESDTLAQIDEAQEKSDAVQFVTAMGGLMEQAGPIILQAPSMAPFVGEIMLFAARKMRAGRSLESALEKSLQATAQMIEEKMRQPPPPNPQLEVAQVKADAEKQRTAAEMQMLPMEMQAEAASNQAKLLTSVVNLNAAKVKAATPQKPPARTQ